MTATPEQVNSVTPKGQQQTGNHTAAEMNPTDGCRTPTDANRTGGSKNQQWSEDSDPRPAASLHLQELQVEDTEGAAAQPAQSETITETRGRVHKDWEGSAAVLCCAESEKAYRQHALSSHQRCRETASA